MMEKQERQQYEQVNRSHGTGLWGSVAGTHRGARAMKTNIGCRRWLAVWVGIAVLAGFGTAPAFAAPGPGRLGQPSGGSATGNVYNSTHWTVQAGATITGTIFNATDASTGMLPCSTNGKVNVIIHSTPFGNTTVCGTLDDSTITFTWTAQAPTGGSVCETGPVGYNTNGNLTNNFLISGGSSSGGYAYVDANGNLITDTNGSAPGCGTTTPPPTFAISTQVRVIEANGNSGLDLVVVNGTIIDELLISSVTSQPGWSITVRDKAILTFSGSDTPTGTVTFKLFNNDTCDPGTNDANVIRNTSGPVQPVSPGLAVAFSDAQDLINGRFTFNSGGMWAYKASYTPDSNATVAGYSATTDPECEAWPIPDPTTTIHLGDGSLPPLGNDGNPVAQAGQTVYDTALVDTNDGPVPDNSTVTFRRFKTTDCTGTYAEEMGAVCPAGNVQPDNFLYQCSAASSSYQIKDEDACAGGISYLAIFDSGDENAVPSTAGACEPLTVLDTTKPVITCSNSTVVADGQCKGSGKGSATAADACGASVTCSPVTVSLTGANSSESSTCTATDPSNNTSTCTWTVTLVDQTPPTIGCQQGPIVVVADAQCQGSATTSATATDNCDPSVTPQCFSSGVLSGAGSSGASTCTASDISGNGPSSCSTVVTLVDQTPPTVSCVFDPNIPVCYIVAASDNCGTVTTSVTQGQHCDIPAGTIVTANDPTGNSAIQAVCPTPPLGPGHGLTLGFWSNKNGQALITAGDLVFLSSLNLRNATGSNFDPSTKTEFKNWILSATATNMAYMLSAQLAAMKLNVLHNGQSSSQYVYTTQVYNACGKGYQFGISIGDLMAAANTELGLHSVVLSGSPYRSCQEAMKTVLDKANNNYPFFVQ